MSLLNDIINGLGLVDEEEVYEDELEQKQKPKEEKKSFFSRKKKEEEAPEGEEKPAKKGLNFSFGKKKKEETETVEASKAEPAKAEVAKVETPAEEEKPAKKSFFGSFRKGEKKEETPVKKETTFRKRPERTINLPIDNRQVNVIIIEPIDFNDSQKIADYLRNGQPVVVNFDGVEAILTKRMTDFISGTIYALNGSMKKLGRNILVCAPRNVDIDAGTEYEEKGEKPWKQ